MTTTRSTMERQKDAIALWEHLYGDLEGYLCISHAQRTYDFFGNPNPKETYDFKQTYFWYPERKEEAITYALEQSDKGREVWFCKHLLTGKVRQKEYATGILALGTEYDGAPLPNSNLTPTARVESSPGHYHSYQRLERPLDPQIAENLNERLSKITSGDKWPLASLLRVPGTRNYKYAHKDVRFTESPIVTLKEITDHRYSPETLEKDLPPVEEKKEYTPGEGEARPPVMLTGESLRVWRGESPVLKSDGTVDRSESLFEICRVLYNNGLINCTAMVASLRERDETLGWNKYTDRRDDNEYVRIFSRFEDEPYVHPDFIKNQPSESSDKAQDRHRGTTGRRLNIVRAIDVKPTKIKWRWEGWLAEGKFGLWDGDPGVGKSLITTSITATLTTGGTLPDGTTVAPMNVLICNLEDGISDTLVPRLITEGADLERVSFLDTLLDENDNPTPLYFPRDLDLLEATIVDNDIAVVFSDPIATMVEGDITKDQEAKKSLTPIAAIADRTGASIIGVRHFIKGQTTKAINKGGGSLGAVGVARTGVNFEYHPDDMHLSKGERRVVMAQSKTNISKDTPSLMFKKVTTGKLLDEVKIDWLGTCDLDADALARASADSGKKDAPGLVAAITFIENLLEDGPIAAEEANDAVEQKGITNYYRNEAKKKLLVNRKGCVRKLL